MLLQAKLSDLRDRLDALGRGGARDAGLFGRWHLPMGHAMPPRPRLAALDRELDRVGVHTSADAKLLRDLRRPSGRVAALQRGLKDLARKVLREFDRSLSWLERATRSGAAPHGALSELERDYPKLSRIAKVADLFAERRSMLEAHPLELYGSAHPGSATHRYVKAQAAVAAYFAERARLEPGDLVRKKRDLDRAHELLLRMGRTPDRAQVHALRVAVVNARSEAVKWPATRTTAERIREARRHVREDPQAAYRVARELFEGAVEAGDRALAAGAHAMLAPVLERAEQRPSPKLEIAPLAQLPTRGDDLTDAAYGLEDRHRLFELAAGAHRYFDIEDSLGEEVFVAEPLTAKPRPRRVPYPTDHLTFATTHSFDDLSSFVISDPRMLLYDVASGRQLVRAYLAPEPTKKPQRVKRTSVRVYVCDASGSMEGARARFRDAILLAELDNLRHKAKAGQPFDPLYFCFFNDSPRDLTRVEDARAANRHIAELFGHSPAEGQTDITLALVSAFDSIRAAQGKDPYLARATVVLVTDGEDRVDLEWVRKARAPMEALRIALSFISLGEENPDLRALIEEQRAAGERAFYHHLSDAEIASAPTDFDLGFRTLIPERVELTDEDVANLMQKLSALEQLASGQTPTPPPRAEHQLEVLFPEKPSEGVDVHSVAEIDRVADILNAVAEAVALAPPSERAGESGVLLEHLLGLYGLSIPAYLELLGAGDARIEASLRKVRLLCAPFH